MMNDIQPDEKEDTIQISINLPTSLCSKGKKAARKEMLSFSAWVRRLIADKLGWIK